MAQFLLHLLNIGLSLVAIGLWKRAGRASRFVESVRWWPLSLFISNLLFSIVAIVDVNVFDFVSPIFLNYWGQAVRIHMLIVFVVGSGRMLELFSARRVQRGS